MVRPLDASYCNGLIDRLYLILCFFEQDIKTRNSFLLNVEHEVIGASYRTKLSDYIRLANKLSYIRFRFSADIGRFEAGTSRHTEIRREILSCIRIVEKIRGEYCNEQ